MRPLTAIVLPAAATVIAACTPVQWVKPDASPAQLEQDAAHCQQEAWREARSRAWRFHAFGPMVFRDSGGRRFLAWPHDPWGDPFGDPYLEEGRLAQYCMRSKGYQLVPVEPRK